MQKQLWIIGLVISSFCFTAGMGYLVLQKMQTPITQPTIERPVAERPAAEQPLSVTEQPLGAAIPVAVARFETSLQSSISASATSMTLVSGTDAAGNSLSGFLCFTIDEGTTIVEDVCGTASSTSVTSITRGINPVTGTSSVSSLKFAHRRGASVKITDHPHVALHGRLLNGQETLPNGLIYDPSITTTTLAANTSFLASVAYANQIALQGAPTATGTTPGILELSSRTQLSAGTLMDGAYTLVPSNGFFSYNPQAATSVPVSNGSGKIAQGWLDLTQDWTFTGTLTLATTTVSGLDVYSHLSKFGGTGQDGALNISSGTTTVSCGGFVICEKNYSSISITGTGVLAFSDANASGTIVILKSQGNVTITCSTTPCINAKGFGPAGGASLGAVVTNTNGLVGNQGIGKNYITLAGAAGGTGGAITSTQAFRTYATSTKHTDVFVGAGGSSGNNCSVGNGTGSSGAGGAGGGAIILEVGGYLNFTATNGISVGGANGSNGTGASNANVASSGGGGGGGGYALVLYNNLTSKTGTIDVAGGTGGQIDNTNSTACTGGGGGGSFVNAGASGSSQTIDGTVNGGTGGAGFSIIQKNTDY